MLSAFPKAIDCEDGHIGKTVWTWFWEQDDDRGYLLKVPRCSHCDIPNGPDLDTSLSDQDDYYRGVKPKIPEDINK